MRARLGVPGASFIRPRRGTWQVVLRFLWRAVRERRWDAAMVVLGGLVVGFVATFKSLVEARVLGSVDELLRSGDTAGAGALSWSDVLSEPLPSLSVLEGTWLSRYLWLPELELTLVSAVMVYVAVSLAAAVLVVVTSTARQGLQRAGYAMVFEAGIAAAFSHHVLAQQEVQGDDRHREPGGTAGAVQQGSGALASSHATILEAVGHVTAIITVTSVLAGIDVMLSLVGVALVVLVVLAVLWQGRHLHGLRARSDEQRRFLFAAADDVVENRDVLLAHERKGVSLARLRTRAVEFGTTHRMLTWREDAYESAMQVVQELAQVGILLLAVGLWLEGRGGGSVGDAYFFFALAGRVMWPVRLLLHSVAEARRAMSSSETLMGLLTEAGDPSGGSRLEPDDARDDAVTFDDVDFAYPGRDPVLQGCTFRVPRGGVTLLLGRSGCGKTTVARMMLGFLHPTSGQVSVLGGRVEEWDHEALLRQMSYLAQTHHVVDGSIEDNLFPAVGISREELVDALVAARLFPSAAEASASLASPAKDLSEGQRQRLALARIFADRDPLVVLDEPLAGVDSFTFSEVRTDLARHLRHGGRTVVVISHRLSLASCADHVVVLGTDGRVLEQGSPDELFRRSGSCYRSLVMASVAETEAAKGAGVFGLS